MTATLAALPHPQHIHDPEPEENWDDDFEFHAEPSTTNTNTSASRGATTATSATRLRTADNPLSGNGNADYRKLSTATEDWDVEEGPSTLGISATATATHRPSAKNTPIFADTLARPPASLVTENWDDDYEYARNSPQKVFPAAGFSSSSSPSPKSRRPGSPLSRSAQAREESWDEELELEEDEEEDGAAEFGLRHRDDDEEEEDRTVTARSRRAPRAAPAPPPPLPPFPLSILRQPSSISPAPPTATAASSSSPTLSSFAHPDLSAPRPFPSPSLDFHHGPARASFYSPSVFSLPGTVHSVHSATTYRSTAPLRPSTGGSSSQVALGLNHRVFSSSSAGQGQGQSKAYGAKSAFALLPPSPPIHKERERRRLRKKSRPRPRTEGMVLLAGTGWEAEAEAEDVREDGLGWEQGQGHEEQGRASFESFEAELDEAPDEGAGGDGQAVHGPALGSGAAAGADALHRRPSATSSTHMAKTRARTRAETPVYSDASSSVGGHSQSHSHNHDRAASSVPPPPPPHPGAGPGSSSRLSSTTGLPLPPLPGPVPVTPSRAKAGRRVSSGLGVGAAAAGGGGIVGVGSGAGSGGVAGESSSTGTGTGTGLLKRIGSVKRWGQGVGVAMGRRRGASATPSEVLASERSASASEQDQQRTPRPRSSLSSFHVPGVTRGTPSSPSSSSTHWTNLFRGSTSPKTRRSTVGAGPAAAGYPRTRRSVDEERSRSRGGYGHRNVYPHALGGARASRASVNGSRTSLSSVREHERMGDHRADYDRARQAAYTPSPDPDAPARVGERQTHRRRSSANFNEPPSTPSKLVKRKSLAFIQLMTGRGGGDAADLDEDSANGGANEGGRRGAKYTGLGLGHAGESPHKTAEEPGARERRKSLSRVLSSSKDPDAAVNTVPKDGARGFLGSVRRISLVGRHKRTKSGSGVALASATSAAATPTKEMNGVGPPVSPSANFNPFGRRSMSRDPVPPLPATPYGHPALPNASASQLSMRLPSSSSSHNHLPLPPPSSTKMQSRMLSTSSSQGSSSIQPASSNSSRNASGASANSTAPSVSATPLARGPSTQSPRSRASVEGTRRPSISSVSAHLSSSASGPSPGRQSLDFDIQLRRSVDQNKENASPIASALPPVPLSLLPPIELQPPSPPQTIGAAQASSVASSAIKPSALTSDANTRTLGTQLNNISPTTSASSLFYTPSSSPHPPASPNKAKLVVPASALGSPNSKLAPGSPGKSSSLGRATASNSVISPLGGLGVDSDDPINVAGTGTGASGKVPRRNSLGDLKIPARISRAQESIKRDLGLVREFAGQIGELKALQDTYTALLMEVQAMLSSSSQSAPFPTQSPEPVSILDAQTTTQIPALPPAASSANNSTGFFANLTGKGKGKVKGRARSNTNPQAGAPSSVSTTSPLLHQQRHQSDYVPDAEVHPPRFKSEIQEAETRLLTTRFHAIAQKYHISWECAELLIELGGGPPAQVPPTATDAEFDLDTAPALHASKTEPTVSQKRSQTLASMVASRDVHPAPTATLAPSATTATKKRSRERAITLAGDVYPSAKPSFFSPPESASTAHLDSNMLPTSIADPRALAGSQRGQREDGQRAPKSSQGPPPASPPNMAWRASTGRHDLSQRQLVLLREMLGAGQGGESVTDPVGPETDSDGRAVTEQAGDAPNVRKRAVIPEESTTSLKVDREWRWGDARNSTITLPTPEEEESHRQQRRRVVSPTGDGSGDGVDGKRKKGISGMAGIRDMLRALKRNRTVLPLPLSPPLASALPNSPGSPFSPLMSGSRMRLNMHSTASLNTLSSSGSRGRGRGVGATGLSTHRHAHPRIPSRNDTQRQGLSSQQAQEYGRDGSTINGDLETTMLPSARYPAGGKSGPRRPSLASIFRMGSNKGRGGTSETEASGRSTQVEHSGRGIGGTEDVAETDESTEGDDRVEDGRKASQTHLEEDWDRMDSASDLDAAAAFALAQGMNTVRGAGSTNIARRRLSKTRKGSTKGHSPYLQPSSPPLPLPIPSTSTSAHSILPKRSFTSGANANSSSQSSLSLSASEHGHRSMNDPDIGLLEAGGRTIRLSNVEENLDHPDSPVFPVPRQTDTKMESPKIGPARRIPLQPHPRLASASPSAPRTPTSSSFNHAHLSPLSASFSPTTSLPSASPFMSTYMSTSGIDPKLALAMTPENIKPLLENAKEVHARLSECIVEIRALIEIRV